MFDRERNGLIEVGETLHGPQWKRPLARDLGVTESTVRGWTSGRRAPPDDLEQRLADLLNGRSHSPRKRLQTGRIAERAPIETRAQRTARARPARTEFAFVSSPPARPTQAAPAPPSRAIALPPTPAAPPVSMVAIGGKPGRGLVPQGRGYSLPPDFAAVSPYTRAEEFRAHTTIMLAALAARADAQDRRIAALEAAAVDRRANALDVARALGGIIKLALTQRG
jgi:hypothetical protein